MTFRLPETITVWRNTGNNGYGQLIWSPPVVQPGRYALRQERFTDANGNTAISRAVCYLRGDIAINDALLFGSSINPTPAGEYLDVKAVSQVPSGAGDLKKVWL